MSSFVKKNEESLEYFKAKEKFSDSAYENMLELYNIASQV